MVHERRKVTKIVEELTIFFFSVGASNMNSSIEYDGFNASISFSSDFDPEYREKVEELKIYFNEPKNDGMEDIFWELAGSGDPGEPGELLLLGMMVDRAEVVVGEDVAELKLYKQLIEKW